MVAAILFAGAKWYVNHALKSDELTETQSTTYAKATVLQLISTNTTVDTE